ncbi:hypothetical protein QJS10_CPB13g01398 [Acorus calamus]|uniref:Uncharacterized protein n=1 Tax=Acorus calamus TaxID=4465 RepID=A0AAV9DI87_ACOCL|nr:hypothetical protein QJS10_CPB13g01398 [Acorus calamus]
MAWENKMPAMLMIVLMVLLAIMNMLYKLTINDEMNLKTLEKAFRADMAGHVPGIP